MKAVVVDPSKTGRLAIQMVDRPMPLPFEAVVKVAAISLNRGEVRRSLTAEAGWRPGWDFAGTIEQAAADGSGFPVGTRVVGMLPSGAWAEQIAAPTHAIAELPSFVSFAQAATLPVAGLTALLALEKGGSVLGRSVLITGASGGVGHFACQLARYAGARLVVAQVRRSDLVEFVKVAGAHQVVVGDDPSPAEQYGFYDVVLDSVGGQTLPGALNLLAVDGTCVTFGATAGSEVTLNVSRFYGKGGLNFYGFILFHELKAQPAALGLQRLVKLLDEGHLRPHIALEAPWTEVDTVAQQLTQRQFIGKAVLHLE